VNIFKSKSKIALVTFNGYISFGVFT